MGLSSRCEVFPWTPEKPANPRPCPWPGAPQPACLPHARGPTSTAPRNAAGSLISTFFCFFFFGTSTGSQHHTVHSTEAQNRLAASCPRSSELPCIAATSLLQRRTRRRPNHSQPQLQSRLLHRSASRLRLPATALALPGKRQRQRTNNQRRSHNELCSMMPTSRR